DVCGQKDDTLTAPADAGGSASVLLPAGSYRLTADLGNETREAQFTIQDGQELPFSIEFENAQSQTLPYALAIAGVVGAGVSIWVWWKLLMRGNLHSRSITSQTPGQPTISIERSVQKWALI